MNSLKSQSPIVLLDESTASIAQKTNDINIVDLKLQIHSEIVTVKIAVKDYPATLADIVPMARMLSVKINEAVQRQAIYNGLTIPCHQGCANCCHLLIILSVPEALRLVEEVMSMPRSQYEKLKRHWDSTGDHMREQLPKNLSPHLTNYISYSNLKKISNWHTKQRKPCVFLRGGMCTIYEQRPLVCRDFMVIGSSSQCQSGKVSTKAGVQISPSLVHVLRQLASELEHENQRIIFLHDLFDWYTENPALYNRKWPAPMIVEQFINILIKA